MFCERVQVTDVGAACVLNRVPFLPDKLQIEFGVTAEPGYRTNLAGDNNIEFLVNCRCDLVLVSFVLHVAHWFFHLCQQPQCQVELLHTINCSSQELQSPDRFHRDGDPTSGKGEQAIW
jgi:hypothetical protein